MKKQEYDSNSIKILDGLDGVRKRLTMYLGNINYEGVLQCFKEILSNAIDETQASKTKQKEVIVKLYNDNSISIRDFGRGIPSDKRKETKIAPTEITGAYLAYTIIHAGAKFDENTYEASGGSYGAGSSIVTAVSKKVIVKSFKNKKCYELVLEQAFTKPKNIKENQFYDERNKLLVTQTWNINSTQSDGTEIRYWLDFDYFEIKENSSQMIQDELQVQYLLSNIKFIFEDETSKAKITYFNKDGLKKGLMLYNEKNGDVSHTNIYELNYFDDETKIKVDFVFEWCSDYEENHQSFINDTIYTKEGGTQIDGFVSELRKYINNSSKKDYRNSDITFGLKTYSNCIIPSNLVKTSNQTKSKLITEEVKIAIANAFKKFKLKQIELKEILNFIKDATNLKQKIQDLKQAKNNTKINKKEKMKLLATFTDCSSLNPVEKELYIVEGGSAGGSLKQARDTKTQAVLPVRGKILNSNRNSIKAITNNNELQSLIKILGCGISGDFKYEDLQFHKIIIASDSDADGYEIANLIIFFFITCMPEIIKKGHLFLSNPPLYSIKNTKTDERVYLLNEKALNDYKKTHKVDEKSIMRYKGHGESNPDEIKKTLMDTSTRQLTMITTKNWKDVLHCMEVINALNMVDERRAIMKEIDLEIKE